jgi:hypothetical protein
MFPFAAVVECPQERMIEAVGPTLVCTAITEDRAFQQLLTDATHIDRLNIGPIPTIKLDWLQPHEGNIVDFLFRSRAFQHEGPVTAVDFRRKHDVASSTPLPSVSMALIFLLCSVIATGFALGGDWPQLAGLTVRASLTRDCRRLGAPRKT